MAKQKVLYPLVLVFAVIVSICSLSPLASGQTRILRIVTYNIAADIDGYQTARPGLIAPPANTNDYASGGVLEGIGEQMVGGNPAQPIDILALQEVVSNVKTVTNIVFALNAYYGSNTYSYSPLQGTTSGGTTSGGGPSALIYNTKTVQLIASVGLNPPAGKNLGSSSGMYRQVLRYQFAPTGVATNANNQFYIYNSHYKSSFSGVLATNAAYRDGEAQIIRNNAMTNLPANARILFVGDFNTGDTSEPMFSTLGKPGTNYAIDPFNPSGITNIVWDGNLPYITESTSGLHYRDDYQMMTTNVYYGTADGLSLISGTYRPFGNNGTTAYLGATTDPGNTALNNLTPGSPITAAQLYMYLTNASDHFPVVADYTIPAPPLTSAPVAGFSASPTNGLAPLAVTFTNLSTGATNYLWTFGNGVTSALTNSSTTYTNPGSYTVTLRAVGAGGTNTLSRTNYIVVQSPPPVAGFSGAPTNGLAPLAVTFTNLSTGATNYLWTFGNGVTSSLTNSSTTYTNPGSYTVTLRAVGAGGTNTFSRTNYIVVQSPPPVADFSGTPTNGPAPLTVAFANLSSGATSYLWTLGNGATSTQTSPSTTYTNPGTYTVTLQAVNAGGTNILSRTDYIVADSPPAPVADFSALATNGLAPLTVTFTNLSTGATSYLWAFGDGNTGTQANISNTYTNPGTYTVTLQAANVGGTNTLTRTNYIVVDSPPPAPAADFSASATNGLAPLTVVFTNLSLNATNYLWAFGDGNTGTQTDISNTYTNPGTYTVTLQAVGAGGTNTLSRTNYVIVNALPAVIFFGAGIAGGGEFRFAASNNDGTPITVAQQSLIKIYASTNPALGFSNWTALPDNGSLSNGVLQIMDTNSLGFPLRFYRAVE